MKPIFWIDLEMTGLDHERDHILEVAVILTDWNFNVLDQYHEVVYQPDHILDLMGEWCRKTHGESGLTEKVRNGRMLDKVEEEIIKLIDKYYKADDRVILAGNSVGNDKRFIDAYMRELSTRLHYRIIDVSSFKEVFNQKYNIRFEKKETHRALDDILESIEELKTYLEYVHLDLKHEE